MFYTSFKLYVFFSKFPMVKFCCVYSKDFDWMQSFLISGFVFVNVPLELIAHIGH